MKDNIKVSISYRENKQVTIDIKRYYSLRNSFRNAIKELRGKSNYRNSLISELNILKAKTKIPQYTKVYKLQYTNESITTLYNKRRVVPIKKEFVVSDIESSKKIAQLIRHYKLEIRRDIRDNRTDSKKLNYKFKESWIKDIAFQRSTYGGVYMELNVFLKFFNKSKVQECFTSKKPLTNDNHIGVELEFFTDTKRDDIAHAMYLAGYAKYITLKNDGSIRPHEDYSEDSGTEINILCKESEYESVITGVCKVLNEQGAQVNKSCGYHLHLDMRNREVNTCYNNLVASQPILYSMNPPSRRNNNYCAKSENKKFCDPKSSAKHTSKRYKGINDYAYYDYKTLEIRLHAGTVNVNKVLNWIRLCLSIVNHNELIVRSPTKLSSFIKRLNIHPELALYIAQRIELFADANNNVANELSDYELENQQAA